MATAYVKVFHMVWLLLYVHHYEPHWLPSAVSRVTVRYYVTACLTALLAHVAASYSTSTQMENVQIRRRVFFAVAPSLVAFSDCVNQTHAHPFPVNVAQLKVTPQ